MDYPPICFSVGRAVARGDADRGIVLGGSGQGEQIAANKVAGVRAALCHDLYTARMSRQHNDANVLSMGGRIVAFGLADEILTLWLETPFDGGRHQRRIVRFEASENHKGNSRLTMDMRTLAEADPEIARAVRDRVNSRTPASS